MLDSRLIDKDEIRLIGRPVGSKDAGKTLISWLVQNHLFYNEDSWLQQISECKIVLGGRIERNPFSPIRLGTQVGRIHPIDEEPAVCTDLKILWSDDDICFIAKPAGLPMHESGYFRRKTIRFLLPKILGPDWHAVHRLDRETSGVLICGRSAPTRRTLATMLADGEVTKTYLALCEGSPETETWSQNERIVPAKSPKERATCAPNESHIGLHAETTFAHLRTLANGRSLISAKPLTGRTHQIRLHLQQAKLPIVGDKLYGHRKDLFEAYLQQGNTQEVRRMAGSDFHCLHAWKLKLTHPLTGKVLEIQDENIPFPIQ